MHSRLVVKNVNAFAMHVARYNKSAKDKSANDTSAKPTVRMPTVRKGQQGIPTTVRKTEVRTTPVRSQKCECQQCERDNSANEARVRRSSVRRPGVRMRLQCERTKLRSDSSRAKRQFMPSFRMEFGLKKKKLSLCKCKVQNSFSVSLFLSRVS